MDNQDKKSNGYHDISHFDDHTTILTKRRSASDNPNQSDQDDLVSYSYPIITSSIIRHDADDDELIMSIEKQIRGGDGGDSPTLPITHQEPTGEVKPLVARIPYFGMICSMLSVFCYSVASLIVKLLTDLHALEILGIRSIFQIIFYLSTTLYYGLPFFGLPGQRLDIALRAVFGTIAAISIYISYRLIPLADATTIQFSAPVFVFILAYFILGESITPFHIVTGLVALVGVMFVSKPKFLLQLFNEDTTSVAINYEGIVLAVVACVSTAFGMIMLRKLKHTPVQVVVLWFSIATSVSAFVALYFLDHFVWPKGGWHEWGLLVAIGFAGIGDQLFMTLAFKYESAGVVSVSRTMTIVLAFIWDILLLGVKVHWTSVLGSGLVTTAVLVLALVKSMQSPSSSAGDADGEVTETVIQRLRRKLCCCFPGKGKSTPEERAKLLG